MLTQAELGKALRDLEPGREHEIDVGGVAGLRLRVKSTGAATWVLRYRVPSGQRRVSIGRFPAMGLGAARKAAKKLAGRIEGGADPSAERRADRAQLRVVDLFGDGKDEDLKAGVLSGWYFVRHCRVAGKLQTAKSEAGVRNDLYQVRKHLRSRRALMRKPVAEVKRSDLETVQGEVPASVWRRLRAMLCVAFAHCEEIGAIPPGSNPAARTKALQDRRVERFLTSEERQRLAEALDRAERLGPAGQEKHVDHEGKTRIRRGLASHVVRLLRLIELTGLRKTEAATLRWEWIDSNASVLRLPTTKSGKREIPVTPQALAFLRREQGDVARLGLVCGTPEGQPIHASNISRAWRQIRIQAGLDGRDGKPAMRVHDLRHAFAATAISNGIALPVIAKALGHSTARTTERYAHLFDTAVRDGLAKVGEAIERDRGGASFTVAD
jgi:integrase